MKVQRLVLLIALLSLSNDALASCPTMRQGPPCAEYWRTEAVFIGVASQVVPTPNNSGLLIGPYLRTTVHFTVLEAFKGVDGPSVVLNLDHCGHRFKEGERYLVYAHRNPNTNELDVRAGNTRTRLLSEADADMEYIRGLSPAEPGSRVFGTAFSHAHKFTESFDGDLLQDTKIILEANNFRREVATDGEGRYEFKRVPAGTYRLRAELPAFLDYAVQTVKVNGRECAPVDIHATNKGSISGKVLDANGNPISSVPVSIVPYEQFLSESKEGASWSLTYTAKDGSYRFTRLAPGSYLLVINRTESEKASGSEILRALPLLFYPGVSDVSGAIVIVVGREHEPRDYNFRLPVQ